MIPYFRPLNSANKILIVDDVNFVELTGVSSTNGNDRNTYIFDAKFNIKVDSSVNPRDYDKVIVTVKRKNSEINIPGSVADRLIRQSSDNFSSQTVPQTINSQNLNKRYGTSLDSYPTTIEKRVYSGLQIVEDSRHSDESISTKEVTLVFTDRELNSLYKFSDVIEDSSEIPRIIVDPPLFTVRPNNMLADMNNEMTDITQPVLDPYYSSLTSPVQSSVVDLYATSRLQKRQNSLYAGIVKYYLDVSERRQDEERIKRYRIKENIRKTSSIDFQTNFRVGKGLLNETLEVKFDLYKKGVNIPVESVVKDFDFLSHVEAFESIKKPPVVTASYLNTGWFQTINLTIVDQESYGKITKFNVYVKDINKFGETSSYRFVAETEGNTVTNSVIFNSSDRLMSIRVVPVSTLGSESNVYTSLLFGEGHSSIGNLSMTTLRTHDAGSTRSKVLISLYNIPKDTIKLDVFRRPHDQGHSDSQFTLINSYDLSSQNAILKSYEFVDSDNLIPAFPEYYVQASLSNGRTISTNPRLVNNSIPVENFESVTVFIENFEKLKKNDDFTVSFDLKTTVLASENQRLINFFKDDPALKEIYDQLIAANSNSDSAVGEGDSVSPLYADLYVHEVLRTDLNTDEVSVFEIVTNKFQDNAATRSVKGIKALNPQHSYVYQVFTYIKDPRTLFKNYVRKSLGSDGKPYYYQPFKWDNSSFNRLRTMPDTDSNDLPILTNYDNLTSSPLGQKASVRIEGLGDFVSVSEVIQQRIDRNTVKVSWTFSIPDYTSYYDSFVVMKTVNGKRSFVGRTRLNYIYHELSSKDVGNIYYSVVPITTEFDIDKTAHSNPFILDTRGLVDPQPLGVW